MILIVFHSRHPTVPPSVPTELKSLHQHSAYRLHGTPLGAMMDETEKYKQRLEAIAEKRRLQEEEDKARREMEDEKLRLQQLKRKSLRDQWLMEGAPLSPTSPDAQRSRSPLWGSQAQEMEKRIDKLESESQWLPEEEEKLKEQMEDGQTAVKVAEAGPEIIQDAVLRNGDNNAIGLETAEKNDQSSLLDKTSAVLTNGRGDLEAANNDSVSDDGYQPTTNGHVVVSEDVTNMEMNLSLGEAANDNLKDEEEEESTLVMRAERVIITDEGDDVPEDLAPQEDPQNTARSEEAPLKVEPEAAEEGGEAVEEDEEEVIRAAQETSAQPEQTEAPAETQPHAEDGATQEDVGTNEVDLKGEGQGNPSEDPTSVQLQCPADTLEGTTVAPVPVYSEVQVSALTQQLEAEGETEELTEGAEAALRDQDPASLPDQFQEVPLADPQVSQRTEAGPVEQDPLLSQSKSPDTRAEFAAANSPDSSYTQVPSRAAQGEETQSPKRKSCECCSVM
ncbi:paralemmin-3 isoform X2 [Labrus bergylta]|uniref:paralemmin-3 isoform X2 n=1 Tax=Labrus bergylta TaxID=56723 RepID=UPI003313A240